MATLYLFAMIYHVVLLTGRNLTTQKEPPASAATPYSSVLQDKGGENGLKEGASPHSALYCLLYHLLRPMIRVPPHSV